VSTIRGQSQKVGGIKENANGYSPSGNDFTNFWLT
jgi:peptide/nickel transport system substrate-binding protein